MDKSRAFDSICRTTLINILKSIVTPRKPLNIFKSYLNKRTQQVKLNNVTSKKVKITKDVLQGMVLSYILYVMYVAASGNLNINW